MRDSATMIEHQRVPPEHHDVTLHQPVGSDPELADELSTLETPQPVCGNIAFASILDVPDPMCFAVASSEVAVLVQTSWQGRLQEVMVEPATTRSAGISPRTP